MKEILLKLWFYSLHINIHDKVFILNQNISIDELYEMEMQQYINIGIDMKTSEYISKNKTLDSYKEIYEYLINNKITFILYNDSGYPERLKYIYAPPIGLFIKGEIPDITYSISIVGSRKASDYGKNVAYKFAYDLSTRGILVISGMATGIDSCAHKGALDAGAKTIAILGSGFKNIYPKSNLGLFNLIKNNGCIISEYLPDEKPLAQNFPRRNRIISGLAKYILVVEASEKSGSLITASCALDQGKDVFAIPGNIFSPVSKGTNKLIKDGAKLISDIQDILDEFGEYYVKKKYEGLNTIQRQIVDCLMGGAMTLDYIMEKSKNNTADILSNLSILECNGIIKRSFGNYYMLY